MSHQAMNAMLRNPKQLIKYQMTGRLPRVSDAPATPLRDLISNIPPRLRLEFKGIRLSASLGFNSGAQFHNLEQLYSWLGADQKLIGSATMPYMSWRIAAFNKPLTLAELIPHCSTVPCEEIINKFVHPRYR
ncbi:hypothetical protein I7Z51_002569 [Vibrio parahaemolyticus]|uniref:hypothetical protein n=1 Tax=Vibrio TaxID=662 RepID=UPI001A8CFFA9|nr:MULTISPECIES: hypothetical protein [Vibrio]EGQ7973644.1 hypothetical protein [Vibrio parahaemolyticus]MBO0209854.1 hypothetical protein [Vibrio sp. Vb0877]MCR9811916.1 hypothetical protein [Vibrio parahaemolyticus]